MQTTTETAQPKKARAAKKKSTLKTSPKKSPAKASQRKAKTLSAEPMGLMQEAKAYLASRTRGQKAAIAAGAVGFFTLLANRRGRGLLKTIGGLALPIAANFAQEKIAERASKMV